MLGILSRVVWVWGLLMYYGALRGTDLRSARLVEVVAGGAIHLAVGPTKTRPYEVLQIVVPTPLLTMVRTWVHSLSAPVGVKAAQCLALVVPKAATVEWLGKGVSVRMWRKLGALRVAAQGGLEAAQRHLRHAHPTSTAHYMMY